MKKFLPPAVFVALLAAAIIFFTSGAGPGSAPDYSTLEAAAQMPGVIDYIAAEYDGETIIAQTNYTGQAAAPAPRNELAALIVYAQNRLDAAAPYGAIVRMGRHYPIAIYELARAISDAQSIYYANPTDDEAARQTLALQAAVRRFQYSIIDPYSRYRPFLSAIARGEDVPQKYHLRAAWIATVLNIDWPSAAARGTSPYHVDRQMYELRLRFDEMAALNLNAVIFQISPTADAFFKSELVPWSPWLTGETNFAGQLLDSRGNAFDPLQYAIDLARERNMEFHAWLNPYRITHRITAYTGGEGIILSSTGSRVASLQDLRTELARLPRHPFNTMGQYISWGEGWYVLDPGVPAARQWIVERVMEIVNNYDVDAIHFDDYFYPSGWNDDVVFARYNTVQNNWISAMAFPDTALGRNQWRRENTEILIREVNAAIKEAAPWVKFGVSPGGVWISGDGTTGLDGGGVTATTGSASTTSWSNYHTSFADTRRWVIENFIDYLTPQIYWDWTLPAAPYGPIADWWARLVHDYGPDGNMRNSQGGYATTHLYIGLGLYRMASNPPVKWRDGAEYENEGARTFLRQEHFNLGNANISGSMIFAQNHTRPGRGGMSYAMAHLRAGAWRYPALIPAMPHLGGTAPAAPVNVTVSNGTISWLDAESSDCQMVRTRYFVIYRSATSLVGVDTANPANIYAIVPAIPGQTAYTHGLSMENPGAYNFIITAVNRLHQESPIPAR